MYKILVVFALFSWMSCESDPAPETTASATTEVAQTPQKVAATPVNTPTPTTKGGIDLWIESQEVKLAEEFCLDVKISGTKGLLSMQYSLEWDPNKLEFLAVRGFNLPFLNVQNFGINYTKQGNLSSAWFDNNLVGLNVEDKRKLYEVCFKAKGKSGEKAAVRFGENPTPFEFSVAPENIVGFNPHKGMVTIK